jgi:hypothetical protein
MTARVVILIFALVATLLNAQQVGVTNTIVPAQQVTSVSQRDAAFVTQVQQGTQQGIDTQAQNNQQGVAQVGNQQNPTVVTLPTNSVGPRGSNGRVNPTVNGNRGNGNRPVRNGNNREIANVGRPTRDSNRQGGFVGNDQGMPVRNTNDLGRRPRLPVVRPRHNSTDGNFTDGNFTDGQNRTAVRRQSSQDSPFGGRQGMPVRNTNDQGMRPRHPVVRPRHNSTDGNFTDGNFTDGQNRTAVRRQRMHRRQDSPFGRRHSGIPSRTVRNGNGLPQGPINRDSNHGRPVRVPENGRGHGNFDGFGDGHGRYGRGGNRMGRFGGRNGRGGNRNGTATGNHNRSVPARVRALRADIFRSITGLATLRLQIDSLLSTLVNLQNAQDAVGIVDSFQAIQTPFVGISAVTKDFTRGVAAAKIHVRKIQNAILRNFTAAANVTFRTPLPELRAAIQKLNSTVQASLFNEAKPKLAGDFQNLRVILSNMSTTPSRPITSLPVGRPDRPVDRPVGRPDRPVDRPQDRHVGRPLVRPVDMPNRPVNRPVDRPVGRPDRPVDMPNRPVNRPVDKPVIRPVDRPVNRPVDKPVNRPVDRPVNRPVDKPVNRPVAQPVVAQPVVAQPVVAQPVVAQPVVAQPVVAQPVVAQPAVAQPVVQSVTVNRAIGDDQEFFGEDAVVDDQLQGDAAVADALDAAVFDSDEQFQEDAFVDSEEFQVDAALANSDEEFTEEAFVDSEEFQVDAALADSDEEFTEDAFVDSEEFQVDAALADSDEEFTEEAFVDSEELQVDAAVFEDQADEVQMDAALVDEIESDLAVTAPTDTAAPTTQSTSNSIPVWGVALIVISVLIVLGIILVLVQLLRVVKS